MLCRGFLRYLTISFPVFLLIRLGFGEQLIDFGEYTFLVFLGFALIYIYIAK